MNTHDNDNLGPANACSGRAESASASSAPFLRAARWVAVLSCAGMLACVRHYQVHDPAELVGQEMVVELDDGSMVEARLEPTPRGHVWRTESGAEIATERVRAATTVLHGEGAIVGTLVGTATGVAVGGAAGLLSGDEAECSGEARFCLSLRAEDKAAIGAVVVGVISGVTGIVFGAVGGVQERYELSRDRVVPRVSAQPTRGGASAALEWSF